MPSKPEQDEVVRLLDASYDSSRTGVHEGAEFFAEVHARAVSMWVIRIAVAVGVALAVGAGALGYLAITRPVPASDESLMLQDPGGHPTAHQLRELNKDRSPSELVLPETAPQGGPGTTPGG